jgi:hypothetical protein
MKGEKGNKRRQIIKGGGTLSFKIIKKDYQNKELISAIIVTSTDFSTVFRISSKSLFMNKI